MNELQDKVALALINVSRGDLPPLDRFNHPQHDEECWLEQAQAAIDTIFAALLSDEVVRTAAFAFLRTTQIASSPEGEKKYAMREALTAAVAAIKGER